MEKIDELSLTGKNSDIEPVVKKSGLSEFATRSVVIDQRGNEEEDSTMYFADDREQDREGSWRVSLS